MGSAIALRRRVFRVSASLVGIAWVSGISVGGSVLGFVLQMLLAARYGVGIAIDSYLFAMSAPTFLAALGTAALSYTVMPTLVHAETAPAARATFLQRLRMRLGLGAICFALFGFPAAELQRLVLPHELDLRHAPSLPLMIVLGWIIGGLQIFGALFTIELNAARRPVSAAALILPPNLTAIVAVLVVPGSVIIALAGVLLGTVFTVLGGAALTRRSFQRLTTEEPPPVLVAAGMARIGWTLIAMSCFSAYAIVDAFWAPRAAIGTLASLGYAQRLVIGIGSLLLAGPSAILTPRFAARLRDNGGRDFARDVMRTMIVVGVLAAGIALVLAILSSPLIGAAFGRGAFGAGDVTRLAIIFRAMLPGFCAMIMSVVLTRAVFCLSGVERPMALAGLSWSAIYAATCGILLPLGGTGFGIAYSVAWLAYLSIAARILYVHTRHAN